MALVVDNRSDADIIHRGFCRKFPQPRTQTNLLFKRRRVRGVVSSRQPTDSVSVADRIKPSAHKSPKPSNKVVDAKKDLPSSIQENEDKDDESLGTIIKSQESSSRGTMKRKSNNNERQQ